MKAVVTGMLAAIAIAFLGAQVLDLKVQQDVADRFSTIGVRL